ncbi:MAG: radical SAM family heme chaperone HemW [Filomicrobium sp.]
MRDPAGFGVYVHWPFCAQKCPYCDFNSHVRFGGSDGHSGWDEARFLSAYLRELSYLRERTGPRRATSVFFGGGTPSLMQPETVSKILEEIGRLWPLVEDAEITLEANPGSVEAARFQGYRRAGINRVSIGVQSLLDDDLKALGRIHSVEEARRALEIAVTTFERVSFDLIYARSGQTLAAWKAELDEALRFGPSHLSLYQLTIEPGTVFEKLSQAGKLVVPDGDLAADFYSLTEEMTAAAGLPAYEVSNYAKPGQESRHNLTYWRYGAYVGAGPGAHGRLVEDGGVAETNNSVRVGTETEKHPETWATQVEARGHGLSVYEPIGREAAADEILLMGLRLREGLDLKRLADIGRVRPSVSVIDRLIDQGVLGQSSDGRRLKAVGSGRLLIDELVLQLSNSFEPVSPSAMPLSSS